MQFCNTRRLSKIDTVAAESTVLQIFRIILIMLHGLLAVLSSFCRFLEQSIIYTLPIQNMHHFRPIQLR